MMCATSEVSRFRELSRLVVLVYTKIGGVEVDEGILSSITASTAGDGVPPDSPTYLFLHYPEELLAPLDCHCPKPVEHRQSSGKWEKYFLSFLAAFWAFPKHISI